MWVKDLASHSTVTYAALNCCITVTGTQLHCNRMTSCVHSCVLGDKRIELYQIMWVCHAHANWKFYFTRLCLFQHQSRWRIQVHAVMFSMQWAIMWVSRNADDLHDPDTNFGTWWDSMLHWKISSRYLNAYCVFTHSCLSSCLRNRCFPQVFQMKHTLMKACPHDTRLCVGMQLTTPSESHLNSNPIQTHTS